MKKTILKIKKIEVVNFAPNENSIKFRVLYDIDNKLAELTQECKEIVSDYLTNQIITRIKRSADITYETDDILDSIQIIRIEDEDDVKEKIFNFFEKLRRNALKLKHMSSASDYMHLYDQLKTEKFIL